MDDFRNISGNGLKTVTVNFDGSIYTVEQFITVFPCTAISVSLDKRTLSAHETVALLKKNGFETVFDFRSKYCI